MSSTSQRGIVGRALISLVAAQLLVGCFYFDYNETHVFNPRWTEHSRFHTAMTIYMGAMLAVLGLYYTWRRSGDLRTNLQAAAWLTAVYFLSFFPSALMPGSGLSEPGLDVPLVAGVVAPQLIEGSISLILLAAGYLLAAPRPSAAAGS
jgi:hypothetical protein